MNDAKPEPDEKQFHGWRLLGVIALVVVVVGLASLFIGWIVVA